MSRLSCYSVFIAFTIFAFPLNAEDKLLNLATTSTTYNSGLLDILLPHFTEQTGIKYNNIVVGSGAALHMGRTGKVDAILVHAPEAEQKFIEDGYGIKRTFVMYNDFVVVGPPNDPANIQSATSISEILATIKQGSYTFISRADDSGTHKKELFLWNLANIDPYGEDWYLESGGSMAKTLETASIEKAYTITDRGTWLATKDHLQLKILFSGPRELRNPYHVIVINPDKHPETNIISATKFIEWITSRETRQLINDFNKDGEKLYYTDSAP